MTVQEIGDEFTVLSHQGQAQAKVVHVSGGEVKNVTGIEMIGDDIALIKSETIRNQDVESAEIINEKLKIDVWKFVEKKNPDYKKDVIKHQTLVSLLIEFTEKREEELKANFDYVLEGKDLEIMELEQQIKKMRCCGNFNGHCSWTSETIKDGKITSQYWNKEKQAYCDVGEGAESEYQLWEIRK